MITSLGKSDVDRTTEKANAIVVLHNIVRQLLRLEVNKAIRGILASLGICDGVDSVDAMCNFLKEHLYVRTLDLVRQVSDIKATSLLFDTQKLLHKVVRNA